MNSFDNISKDLIIFAVVGFIISYVIVTQGIINSLIIAVITLIFVKKRDSIIDWLLDK